jgi:prepilin-type N-terminal cleavage/methylation domain-containing protein
MDGVTISATIRSRLRHDLVTQCEGGLRMRGVLDGYTLIEVIVVLVIMGLAAALVAPAIFRSPAYDRQRQVTALVDAARDAAAKRGEVIYASIAPNGVWTMEGGGLPLEGELTHGRIDPLSSAPLTLIVSPVGSCAFDVRSTAAAAAAVRLDPLTCDIRVR